jgi:hypothetical protein
VQQPFIKRFSCLWLKKRLGQIETKGKFGFKLFGYFLIFSDKDSVQVFSSKVKKSAVNRRFDFESAMHKL